MKQPRLAYPEDLVQAIGQYLVTRPYSEVAQLIQGMQTTGLKVEVEIEVPQPTETKEN